MPDPGSGNRIVSIPASLEALFPPPGRQGKKPLFFFNPVLPEREDANTGFIMWSWEYIEEVALMLSLLMVSAFCSAAETAYSAADLENLDTMRKEKRFGAKLAFHLSKRFDSALASILIANTIVCIALSSVGAVVFGDIVKDDEYGAAVSGALLTVLILLFGEISPKLLAKDTSEKLACILAWPLYIMTLLMTPFCYLISLWKRFLLKVFKIDFKQE